MTPPPGRIPPPGRQIPVPIPGPPSTQPPPYAETALTEFEDMPTKVERVCPGCRDPQRVLPPDAQPPGSYGEAWYGRHRGSCRGTDDWWWCGRTTPLETPGRLELTRMGMTVIFRDRRVTNAAVDVDRRGPPRR